MVCAFISFILRLFVIVTILVIMYESLPCKDATIILIFAEILGLTVEVLLPQFEFQAEQTY